MNNLSNIVLLFRKLDDVEFNAENDSFTGSCTVDESCIKLLHLIDNLFPNNVHSLEVKKKFITIEQLAPGEKISKITVTLPEPIFFQNAAVFIEKKGIKAHGSLGFYYLLDENYQSGEEPEPELIKKLKSIFEVIGFFSGVLPHSEKGTNFVKFIYFPEDKNGNTRTKRIFESIFTLDDINADLTSFIKIKETVTQEDSHTPERETVFRNSIAEFLKVQPNNESGSFSYIINNSDKLYEIYKDNYDTYINGFSLEKIKKEITDYHQQFSKAISDGMNEIVTKSLAIPASIAAAALLMRSGSTKGDLFMLAVLSITAVITSMLLSWQKIHIKDNELLIGKAFSSFTEDTNITEKAKNFTLQTMENLLSKAKGVRRRLMWMLIITWTPAVIASCYIFVKYNLQQKVIFVIGALNDFYLSLNL